MLSLELAKPQLEHLQCHQKLSDWQHDWPSLHPGLPAVAAELLVALPTAAHSHAWSHTETSAIRMTSIGIAQWCDSMECMYAGSTGLREIAFFF